VIVREQG